jgi:hypothetical protein
MWKYASLSLLCFLYSPAVVAQTPQVVAQQSQPAAPARPLNFTTQIKKTVALLRVTFQKDGNVVEADGTCFFIFYPDKRGGETFGFVYLVTNRHMAQPGIENGQNYRVISTLLRLNLRNSGQGSEEALLPIGNGAFRWYFPADDSVDLAVVPLLPDQNKYDVMGVPLSLFATRDVLESQNVAEGESVLFSGYFYQVPGLSKFQPIVREGILAMIPDEKLETTLRKPGHLYLADLHVFGGNSGSPLFVNLGGFRNGQFSTGSEYLLGVVSGFYHEDSNLKLTVAATLTGTLEQNSGIAMIVPVDELRALLDTPTFQAARDEQIHALKK